MALVEDLSVEQPPAPKKKGKKKKKLPCEVVVPDATPQAFDTLIKYLVSDAVDVDPSADVQHAFDVIKLADKYDVQRLGLLVTKVMADAVRGETAVPFLEAAQTVGDGRLFAQCRSWIAERPGAVRASGRGALAGRGLHTASPVSPGPVPRQPVPCPAAGRASPPQPPPRTPALAHSPPPVTVGPVPPTRNCSWCVSVTLVDCVSNTKLLLSKHHCNYLNIFGISKCQEYDSHRISVANPANPALIRLIRS